MSELSMRGEWEVKKCRVSLVKYESGKKNNPRQCMRSVVELLAEF